MILNKTQYFRIAIVLFLILILTSCQNGFNKEKWRYVEIFPKDTSQIITVITLGDKRYIMDGRHNIIPDEGYLLLDISDVDPLGDAIAICWDNVGHKWEGTSAYAILIENKLDTLKFKFRQPLGKYGEPTSEGFLGENCGSVLIREELSAKGDLQVNYISNISK